MVVPSALNEYAGVTVIDGERKWLSSSCSSEKYVIVHKSIAEIRVNTENVQVKFWFFQPNQPNQYVPCHFFSSVSAFL